MELIVLTASEWLPDEAAALSALFEQGLQRLHLRKPAATSAETETFIAGLPAAVRPRIVLHDHFALQPRLGLGGIHLNGRNPVPPSDVTGTVSRSCHSLAEVAAWRDRLDYLFLSPVFDSISKQGYRAGFAPEELLRAAREGIIDRRVMALGGITPDNLARVRAWGFGGAAVLGDLWQGYRGADDLPELLRRFGALQRAADFGR